MSMRNLIKLEDLFVRSILEKEDLISNNKMVKSLAEDARSILLNLAASFIYSFIAGRQ